MLIVGSCGDLDRHETGVAHPERAVRVEAALAGLDDAGLRDALVLLEPRRATLAELAAVHSPAHLAHLEAFCARGGGYLDPDTPAVHGSWDTALLAAGAVLGAIDELERTGAAAAFVAARPPGHHATPDAAMGFCLVNNVAVGAAALVRRGQRVLVVDWDVHHGNGTQAAFWDDPSVLYVSTHQDAWYPGTGAPTETGGAGAPGLTLNVAVPAGATGDVLAEAFDTLVLPAAEAFGADWVLVSAGFDAHRDDPLALLELSAGDFADLARRTRALAAPGRLVLVLEGGYDLDALRLSTGATLAAVLDTPYRPEPATSGGPGAEAVAWARRVRRDTVEGES